MRRSFIRSPFEAPTKLPIVQGPELRSGTPTIVGYMPAGVLIPDGYTIPYYDTRTKKGINGNPKIPGSINSQVICARTNGPATAVLLNIRKRDARNAYVGQP